MAISCLGYFPEKEQLEETTHRIYIKQKVKNGRKERKWKGRDFEFQLPLLQSGYITLNTPLISQSFCTYKMELVVGAAPKAVIRVPGAHSDLLGRFKTQRSLAPTQTN